MAVAYRNRTAEITIEKMVVTPRMAQEWLGSNLPHNRNLRPRTVAKYARDMAEGKWQLTGEPIKFDTDGRLVDGQHRLSAVVESEATIELFVANNVSTDAILNIDGGAPRRFSDFLKIRGETNNISLASIIRICYAWEQGIIQDPGKWNAFTPTPAEMYKFFEANHEALRDALRYGSNNARRGFASSSILGALYYICNGHPDWESFSERLLSGVDLQSGSPVLALRRYLASNYERTGFLGGAAGQRIMLALFLKTFEGYVTESTVQVLSFRRGENFPVVPTA